ncbi:MAG: SUF system NifU family Fe-S cluster assembly protein [Deltaproteobacteria bacterium]|nr:SUF system NifU family Fe-S cluster assembly protein [Deltaproteobacteria bacterium]
MSSLRELYQEVILDHNKSPRNCKEIANATHHADGHNPLCGDKIKVYLVIEDNVIKDVSFIGSGCAISTASASLMTESLKGKSESEARHIFERMHTLLTDEHEPESIAGLGKLAVFAGVREFPMRVKCATLSWHTLMAALNRKGSEDGPATTE